MNRRLLLIDGVIALILAVVFGAVTLEYARSQPPRTYFFDWELMPATAFACGHGFAVPKPPLESLNDFVVRRAAAFDCQSIPQDLAFVAPSALARSNRYGLYLPGLFMRLGGTTWQTLDVYLAVLFGVATALSYGILRLFAMPGVALFGAAVLAYSTRIESVLGHRDYIKEPPFLALLFVIAWIARRPRSIPQLRVASAICGLLLGIGIGCRVDLIAMAPFILFAILVLAPLSSTGLARERIKQRLIASAAFVVAFLVTGVPILSALSGGSNTSHTVLLGFTSGFTTHLGLSAPVYDVGYVYSDGFAFTMIAAQVHVREGDRGDVPFGTPEYDRAGARLNADIVRMFPADMLARGFGAALEIAREPFRREQIADSGAIGRTSTLPLVAKAGEWRTWLLTRVEGKGLWITALALAIAAAIDPRRAAFCASAFLYFCAYSMLQFSRRHTFHLDIFPIVAATFVLQAFVLIAIAAWQRKAEWAPSGRQAARNLAISVAAFAVLTLVPLTVLRWWQDRHVATVLQQTLDATLVETAFTRTSAGAGQVLIASDELGGKAVPPPVSDLRDVRLDYLVTDFSGAACGSAPFQITEQYSGVVPTFDKVFTRDRTVVPQSDGQSFRILGPAYYEYGPYWLKFDGFLVPEARASCVTRMSRAAEPGKVPFPFLYAQLGQNWRQSGLYQRFTAWEQ